MTHELDDLEGGILVTDVSGRILYANKVITSSKGLSFKDLQGKHLGGLWGDQMDDYFYGETKKLDKNGQKKSESLHIAPIMNQEGEIEFFIEIQPKHLNKHEELQFKHEFDLIIKNQQKHPEALLELMKTWMGSHPINVSGAYSSPAHFLEALIKEHAEVNLDEDVKWIELAKKDSLYFQELYEKYQHKVFNYFLYRVGKNTPLAEDLTQETFVRAFNALPRFEYRNIHYLSYLLMVAHNLLVNYYRMAKPLLFDDMTKLPVYTDSTAQKEAEMRLVWEAVHKLSPVERNILVMKYNKDLSIKEIAQKLKKTENAVKLQLSRARKKLRKIFL